jgi:hypothetical protein
LWCYTKLSQKSPFRDDSALMNIRQKQIIYVALVLISLTVLFPPWFYENSMTSGEYSAGYHFLFTPPEVKSDAEMREQLSIPNDEMHKELSFIVRFDFYRFIFQIIAIPLLTIGFLLFLSLKRKEEARLYSFEKIILGSISLFVGTVLLILVCLMGFHGVS